MAIVKYNSPQHQLLVALGGMTRAFVMTTLYGLRGLILFSTLIALLPIFFWIPWLVPSLQVKRA